MNFLDVVGTHLSHRSDCFCLTQPTDGDFAIEKNVQDIEVSFEVPIDTPPRLGIIVLDGRCYVVRGAWYGRKVNPFVRYACNRYTRLRDFPRWDKKLPQNVVYFDEALRLRELTPEHVCMEDTPRPISCSTSYMMSLPTHVMHDSSSGSCNSFSSVASVASTDTKKKTSATTSVWIAPFYLFHNKHTGAIERMPYVKEENIEPETSTSHVKNTASSKSLGARESERESEREKKSNLGSRKIAGDAAATIAYKYIVNQMPSPDHKDEPEHKNKPQKTNKIEEERKKCVIEIRELKQEDEDKNLPAVPKPRSFASLRPKHTIMRLRFGIGLLLNKANKKKKQLRQQKEERSFASHKILTFDSRPYAPRLRRRK